VPLHLDARDPRVLHERVGDLAHERVGLGEDDGRVHLKLDLLLDGDLVRGDLNESRLDGAIDLDIEQLRAHLAATRAVAVPLRMHG
jgi:hypothetical protein